MANAVYINYSCSPSGTGKITGTVTSGITWSGSTSTSAGTYLPVGTVLQWTATPVSGYNVSFQAWYYTTSMPDDPVSYSGSFTSMTLGSNWKTLEIRAVYSSVGPSSYSVTFSSTAAQGSISPSGTISYNSGTSVQVTAQANAGYRFNVWTGDFLSGGTGLADNFKTATASFIVNKSGTVTANYWPAYRCDVISSDTSKGTVTKTYSNTQGPWGNIPLYDNNASITLTATALTNYEFVNWTDTNTGTVLSTSNPYTFSLTADKYITGNFRGAEKTISVSVSPSGSGTATVGGSKRYGETCTVTATPATGIQFVNWTEGGTQVSMSASYSFTVTGNRTLVANFISSGYVVSVSANPSDYGVASIEYGTNPFSYNSECVVRGDANPGCYFINWTEGGTQVSTDYRYWFRVIQSRTLVANFGAYTYTISVSSGSGGAATIVHGSNPFYYNDECVVQAYPDIGYHFVNWTENGSSVSTDIRYWFRVYDNRTLVANFSANIYSISAGAGFGGTTTGSGSYAYDSVVTVTATPLLGYQFVNWTDDGVEVSTNSTYSFTVIGDRTVRANFSAIQPGSDDLLVWLPMTKGITDYGLSNIVMINNGATEDSSGKLGNCYSFNGSSAYMSGTLSNINKDCWSAACWVQANQSSSSGHNYMVSMNTSTAADFTFTLCWYHNTFGVRTGDTTYSSDITGLMGVWTHVCATYENSVLKLYITGVLDKTFNSPKAPVAASKLTIGMRAGSAGYFAGKLNDVRIYNDCLSAKEVKEISKGLILHYKLNQPNPNLLLNAATEQSGNSQTAHILYYYYSSFSYLPTGTYTFSFDAKTSNGTDNCYVSYANGASTINRITTLNSIPSTWTHYTYTFTNSSSNSNDIFFTCYKGYGGDGTNTNNTGILYVRNVKLERGSTETSFTLAEQYNTIMYDCSGYKNNGTIMGDLVSSNDTNRYKLSTYFGGSSKIYLPNFNIGNLWSYGCWIYSGISSRGWEGIIVLNNNGSDSDMQLGCYTYPGGNRIQSSANGQYNSTISFTYGQWNHLFATFDGSSLKTYINGVLVDTKSITASLLSSTNLTIGSRCRNALGTSFDVPFVGNLSDVRIYATTLSADDVKELYNTSGSIDNKGNLLIRELNEQ